MLVVIGCVVVLRACEVVVVWVVDLWAAGEYRGIGDGGSCRGRRRSSKANKPLELRSSGMERSSEAAVNWAVKP